MTFEEARNKFKNMTENRRRKINIKFSKTGEVEWNKLWNMHISKTLQQQRDLTEKLKKLQLYAPPSKPLSISAIMNMIMIVGTKIPKMLCKAKNK